MIRICEENKVFIKVWDHEDKGKFVKGRGTSSEKRQNGEYENSNWDLAFVGKCLEKAKEVHTKDLIVVTKGKVTCVPWADATGERHYPGGKITVFDFYKYGDTAISVESSDEEIPY